MSQVLLAAFIGGMIGLDRTALGQFMISQPVVAGPLTGWLLGDLTAGLVIGALELIWVLALPPGTFVARDSTVAAVPARRLPAPTGRAPPPQPAAIGFTLLLRVGTALEIVLGCEHDG